MVDEVADVTGDRATVGFSESFELLLEGLVDGDLNLQCRHSQMRQLR